MSAEISRVELFAEVLEAGSFSAAARRLGGSASAVSRQVDALEDELGVTLLRRTTRTLTLTEPGEVFLGYARRVRDELREARLAVGQLAQEPTGHLRVTCPIGLGMRRVLPLMDDFRARYPRVQVSLLLSDQRTDLEQQRVDVALRFGNLPNSTWRTRKLGDSRSLVCASPRYLSDAPPLERPEDLTRHACLSFRSQPGPVSWHFRDDARVIKVDVDGPLRINAGQGLASAALMGLGVVMLPRWHVDEHVASGQLVPLLDAYALEPDRTPVFAVFAAERYLAPKVRAFVDFLVERLVI